MARDPETIEREIEAARNSLAATFDELSERADLKKLADQTKEAAVSKLQDPRVRYGLIAVGVVVGLLVVRKLFR